MKLIKKTKLSLLTASLLLGLGSSAWGANVTTSFTANLTTTNTFNRPAFTGAGGNPASHLTGPASNPTGWETDIGAIWELSGEIFNYFSVNFTPSVTGDYTVEVISATLNPCAPDYGYGTSTTPNKYKIIMN